MCQVTAMQRTERLFALAEYLRGRRTGVTAEQLAERFNVTVRTMYRDLDALRAAALPLGAERGRGGGYALDRSYSLPPVNFTAREAALIVALGRFAIDMRLLPFADTLERGLDKVRAALSTSAQREMLTRPPFRQPYNNHLHTSPFFAAATIDTITIEVRPLLHVINLSTSKGMARVRAA